MDHRYIDDHSVASRYIDNALSLKDREAFEKHLVDCQECTDRVLLAGMFHARQPSAAPSCDPLPLRARFAAHLSPLQLVLIFVVAAMLLLAIPSIVMLYLR
jgi:hypothetical protein